MSVTSLRLILSATTLLALAGCGTTQSCGGDPEYLKAKERPRLQFPPEVNVSERISPIAIPPADPNPQKLDPVPRCLDYPPPFFARKPGPGTAATPAPASAPPPQKPDSP
jgi:uncharacterized lipoprotein